MTRLCLPLYDLPREDTFKTPPGFRRALRNAAGVRHRDRSYFRLAEPSPDQGHVHFLRSDGRAILQVESTSSGRTYIRVHKRQAERFVWEKVWFLEIPS